MSYGSVPPGWIYVSACRAYPTRVPFVVVRTTAEHPVFAVPPGHFKLIRDGLVAHTGRTFPEALAIYEVLLGSHTAHALALIHAVDPSGLGSLWRASHAARMEG